MAAHYESKHGFVAIPAEQLYMSFTDLSLFTNTLPEEYRNSVEADYDTLRANVKGITIAIRVAERRPYSLIRLEDTEAPFHFSASLHFDVETPRSTDFWLEVDADLNFVMKAMIGGRLQEALDKAVDTLVAVSQGKQSQFPSDLG